MLDNPYKSPEAETARTVKDVRWDATWGEVLLVAAVAGLITAPMTWFLNIHRVWIYAVALSVAFGALFAKRKIAARRR